jgi:hypothetical protein
MYNVVIAVVFPAEEGKLLELPLFAQEKAAR